MLPQEASKIMVPARAWSASWLSAVASATIVARAIASSPKL
jgi:hypothetical protein